MAYLDSKAELAGVIGHEIGHVTARHSVRQQAGQTASTLLSADVKGYSRLMSEDETHTIKTLKEYRRIITTRKQHDFDP